MNRPHIERRLTLAALASAGVAGVASTAGCSLFSSSKSKKPDSPVPLATPGAAVGGPATAAVGRVAWQASIGSMGSSAKGAVPPNFAPAFAAGSIWAASADGNVVRMDASTGAREWQINVNKPLVAGAGCDGETVVVASRDGTIIALDAKGVTRWTQQMSAEVVSVPAVGLGIVIVRLSDNRVFAFDSETGKRRWQVSRQNPALVLRQTNSVAITSGTSYIGLPGGRLLSVSLLNGAQRWETAISQPKGANEIERIADIVGTPLLSGRELCAATFQGKLACVDAATGRTLWSRDLAATSGIEIDTRLVAAVDDKGQVHAFSRTGTSLWRQTRTAGRMLTAPLSVDNYLAVGDDDGFVYILSRDDGAIVGRVSTDGSGLFGLPCAADKLAVFQSNRGSIFAIRMS